MPERAAMAETDYDNCGTYAGWNRHRVDRTRTCDACKEAARLYARQRREKNPEMYAAEKRLAKAHERALWRLARLHPAQFQALVTEEREGSS